MLDKYNLKNNGLKKYISSCGYNKGKEVIYSQLSINSTIKAMRKSIYIPKKKITKKLLDWLDPQGLAIWYMDDGSLSNRSSKQGVVKSSLITISTCVDTMEENQLLIDYLMNTYGIQFYQRKMKGKYALTCGTREGRKFIDLIKHHVEEIQCMRYKLDIKR